MANENSQEEQTPEVKQAGIQIGIDWDNGVVVLTTSIEGMEKPIDLRMPAEVFVQAGIAIGMQLAQRLKALQPNKSGLVLASAGDLPPIGGKPH